MEESKPETKEEKVIDEQKIVEASDNDSTREEAEKKPKSERPRRPMLNLLKENVAFLSETNRPIKPLSISINTFQANRFFGYFERFDLYTHHFHTLPTRGGDKMYERVMPTINEGVQAVKDNLDKELERLTNYQEANFVLDVSYTSPTSIDTFSSTPVATKFLDCILLADKIVVKADSLWLDGVIDDKQRNEIILSVNSQMYRLTRSTLRLVYGAFRQYQRSI